MEKFDEVPRQISLRPRVAYSSGAHLKKKWRRFWEKTQWPRQARGDRQTELPTRAKTNGEHYDNRVRVSQWRNRLYDG